MQQGLRRALKTPLAAWGAASQAVRPSIPGITFLGYHSVTGRLPLELDLPYPVFRRQLETLAARGAVVAYDEALAWLAAGRRPPAPRWVLTFDDGYEDFYTHVFPLLAALHLPATLFVTTGFVDDGVPYPLMARPDLTAAPVTWPMLGEMAASPWVTLGAHTHTHPLLDTLPAARVEEELVRPLERFQRELGLRPRHFAYPRAIWNPALAAQVARHYASAVAGGGERGAAWDAYRIPRLPIRRSDGRWFFGPKLRGWLDGEEAAYRLLHRLLQRLRR